MSRGQEPWPGLLVWFGKQLTVRRFAMSSQHILKAAFLRMHRPANNIIELHSYIYVYDIYIYYIVLTTFSQRAKTSRALHKIVCHAFQGNQHLLWTWKAGTNISSDGLMKFMCVAPLMTKYPPWSKGPREENHAEPNLDSLLGFT